MAVQTADEERALWALRQYDATALATVGGDGSPHVVGVFYAPGRQDGGGIVLIAAVTEGARSLADMQAHPAVAFMCSPGNASRWIQGRGVADVPALDPAETLALFRRLAAHAPGAQSFIEAVPVRPVLIRVSHLRIVEAPDRVLVYGSD